MDNLTSSLKNLSFDQVKNLSDDSIANLCDGLYSMNLNDDMLCDVFNKLTVDDTREKLKIIISKSILLLMNKTRCFGHGFITSNNKQIY